MQSTIQGIEKLCILNEDVFRTVPQTIPKRSGLNKCCFDSVPNVLGTLLLLLLHRASQSLDPFAIATLLEGLSMLPHRFLMNMGAAPSFDIFVTS